MLWKAWSFRRLRECREYSGWRAGVDYSDLFYELFAHLYWRRKIAMVSVVQSSYKVGDSSRACVAVSILLVTTLYWAAYGATFIVHTCICCSLVFAPHVIALGKFTFVHKVPSRPICWSVMVMNGNHFVHLCWPSFVTKARWILLLPILDQTMHT